MTWRCPCCGTEKPEWIDPVVAVQALGVHGERGKMAELLAKRFGQYRNSDCIAGVVIGDRPSGGPLWAEQRIRVMRCHLNQILARVGLRIETHLGIGYRMTQVRQ